MVDQFLNSSEKKTVKISMLNGVFCRFMAEQHILYELKDYFTFPLTNISPYAKRGRLKYWNGKISLFNLKTNCLYNGNLPEAVKFLEAKGYKIEYQGFPKKDDFTVEEARKFIDSLKLPFEVNDHQFTAFYYAIKNKRQLIVSATGCQAEGDKVLMYNGFYENIENVKVGDLVIGIDGQPKKVLHTFEGEDDLYEISIRGRSLKKSITVTGEHILPLKFSDYKNRYGHGKGNKEFIDYVTVNDYLFKKCKYYKHVSNLFYNNKEISFSDEKIPDSKLSPYFIGCYIGDGHTYSPCVTNIDVEVINEIYRQASFFENVIVKKRGINYNLTGLSGRKNPIAKEFRNLGIIIGKSGRTKCEDKFIPKNLLHTPVAYRLELLAGLIDTDGWLENKTYYGYCSKSEKLVNDVSLLATSLGLSCTQKETFNKRFGKKYYAVMIHGDIGKIPVRIPRKKDVKPQEWKDRYRQKFDITPKGKGKYYGIEVEDSLYITNDGMVTHNSGKSLIIYLIAVYLHKTQKKGLLVVPTINLVEQMYKDFKFYSKNNKIDVDALVHRVYGGVSEKCSKFLTISTWQSIFKLPRDFFKDFDFVLGDEAHLFQAGSLTSIMKKLVNTNYRIGDTGTLQESKTHHKVLEGLFGPILQVTTSKELQEKGILSDLRIRCVLLEHGLDQPKPKSWSYQNEIEFIISSEKRNKFLVNLALSLDKNTLLLVNHVEKHGQILYDMLQKLAGNRPVYFVHGGVNKDEREEVRLIVEKEKDAVIVASYGVFSTGVNIKNLHNLIFGYPVKSKIRNLQSIGRVLRVPDDGGVATLYDISDHIPISDDTLNHTFRHFISRVQIYDEEKFPYRMFKIPL